MEHFVFRKRISSSIGNDQSAIHITSKQENNWRKRPQTIRFSKQNIWNKIMDLWMHKNKNGKIKHQKPPPPPPKKNNIYNTYVKYKLIFS